MRIHIYLYTYTYYTYFSFINSVVQVFMVSVNALYLKDKIVAIYCMTQRSNPLI